MNEREKRYREELERRKRTRRVAVLTLVILALLGGVFAIYQLGDPGKWSADTKEMLWALLGLVVTGLVIWAVVILLIPAPKTPEQEDADAEAMGELFRVGGMALLAANATVDSVQTPKGAVIIEWASLAGFLAPRPEERDAELRKISEKIASILQGNPDTDLAQLQSSLGIKVLRVQRAWEVDSVAGRFAASAKNINSLVELERFRTNYLKEHPEIVGTELEADLDAIVQMERARILMQR